MTARSPRPATILIAALGTILVMALLWVTVLAPRMTREAGIDLGHGDYRLTATDGTPFTEDSLKGGPTAVFFGFTHCPEVCPTTLADIAQWKDDLGALAQDLRVVFITVDPERDTPELLADYVSWVPGAVGVTGSQDEIDKAIRAFRIFARKVPLADGDYTMDHSALVLLFDADGQFFEPVGYQEDFARVKDKLTRLLG